MRTIALLASMGLLAAAEQPKNAPLNTAEQIALRAVVTESKRLSDQQTELKKQFDAIVADACQRVHQAASCKLNDDGTLAKVEAPKDVKK